MIEKSIKLLIISRAKKKVFISIPKISENLKEKLTALSFIQIKVNE
ncbi:hypothetical protein [Cetobacterium ceti]|nr:hypothetical protein [Cetobacterium ceti]